MPFGKSERGLSNIDTTMSVTIPLNRHIDGRGTMYGVEISDDVSDMIFGTNELNTFQLFVEVFHILGAAMEYAVH
jgi:hypothetical protein